jgi:hypothetical protein
MKRSSQKGSYRAWKPDRIFFHLLTDFFYIDTLSLLAELFVDAVLLSFGFRLFKAAGKIADRPGN